VSRVSLGHLNSCVKRIGEFLLTKNGEVQFCLFSIEEGDGLMGSIGSTVGTMLRGVSARADCRGHARLWKQPWES
jgi:hypothetical protein